MKGNQREVKGSAAHTKILKLIMTTGMHPCKLSMHKRKYISVKSQLWWHMLRWLPVVSPSSLSSVPSSLASYITPTPLVLGISFWTYATQKKMHYECDFLICNFMNLVDYFFHLNLQIVATNSKQISVRCTETVCP